MCAGSGLQPRSSSWPATHSTAERTSPAATTPRRRAGVSGPTVGAGAWQEPSSGAALRRDVNADAGRGTGWGHGGHCPARAPQRGLSADLAPAGLRAACVRSRRRWCRDSRTSLSRRYQVLSGLRAERSECARACVQCREAKLRAGERARAWRAEAQAARRSGCTALPTRCAAGCCRPPAASPRGTRGAADAGAGRARAARGYSGPFVADLGSPEVDTSVRPRADFGAHLLGAAAQHATEHGRSARQRGGRLQQVRRARAGGQRGGGALGGRPQRPRAHASRAGGHR